VAGPLRLLPAPDNSIPAPDAKRVSARLLCYVTDRNSLTALAGNLEPRVLGRVRGAIDAGVDWVQIREKDLPAQKLLALVESAVDVVHSQNGTARVSGPRFQAVRAKVIVNDRLDVALAASAAGVHLGRESAPLREAVRWCRSGNAPNEFLIGASCHTLAESREAESAGASYLIFGPVFDTPSKRAFGRPVGIAELSMVCAAVKIPVLAIGGIELRNAGECFKAGASGIAAIRMFQDPADANELRNAVEALLDDSQDSATR
jgi:thiamine-phosphate pyrophosphorylase